MSRDRISCDFASKIWLIEVCNDFEIREGPRVPGFTPSGIVDRRQEVRVKDILNVSLPE